MKKASLTITSSRLRRRLILLLIRRDSQVSFARRSSAPVSRRRLVLRATCLYRTLSQKDLPSKPSSLRAIGPTRLPFSPIIAVLRTLRNLCHHQNEEGAQRGPAMVDADRNKRLSFLVLSLWHQELLVRISDRNTSTSYEDIGSKGNVCSPRVSVGRVIKSSMEFEL